MTGPTLDEIRTTWPATVSVADACRALGFSARHGYTAIKSGTFPGRVIVVGRRVRVVTASIVAVLSKGDTAA